jgi:purine-nucleoside phosphorylase
MSKFLESKTSIRPVVGIICGSGLGNIGELVENKTILSYDEIPDFPRSTGRVELSREDEILFNSYNF